MGHSPFSPPLRVPRPPAAPHHQVDVVELQAQWAALPHQQPPPLPRGHCCVLPCTSTHQYESSQLSQYHPIYSHIVPVWLRDPPSTRGGGGGGSPIPASSSHPTTSSSAPSIPIQSLPEFPVHPVSISSHSQSLSVLPASPSAPILTFQSVPLPSVSPSSSTSLISVSNATKAPISLWDSTRTTSAGGQRSWRS